MSCTTVRRRGRLRLCTVILVGLGLAGCAMVPDSWTSVTQQKRKPSTSGLFSYSVSRKFELGYEPNGVVVTPLGDLVATSRVESSFIDLWSAGSGKKTMRLTGHRLAPVGAMQFSDDGTLLVSAGGVQEVGVPEPSVRVWDTNTGKMVDAITEAQTAMIVSLAVSSDAQDIVLASSDSLKVWSRSASRTPQGMWVDHTKTICGMAASPDLGVMATGAMDDRVLLRHASRRDRFDALYGHEVAPCGLKFSPDGQMLVSWDFGSRRSTIRIWDADRAASRGHVDINGRVFSVFFERGEPVAVIRGAVAGPVRSEDRVELPNWLTLVSLTDGTVLGELDVVPKRVATSPNGDVLVAATWDGVVSVFRRGGAR
jgi:WD40 repeat protein